MINVILLDFVKPIVVLNRSTQPSKNEEEENYESRLKKRKMNPEKTIEPSCLILDHLDLLARKLKTKIPVAFSTNFEFVGSKGVVNKLERMTSPLDVKISYRNEVILVSDSQNKRVLVFDSKSGKFKFKVFPEEAPWQFVLEQDYDGHGNEAFIYSTGSNYIKHDLFELLKSTTKKKKPPTIWSTEMDSEACYQSSVIKYSKSGNILYGCSSGGYKISVYSCKDGSLIRNIEGVVSYEDPRIPNILTFERPVGIDYICNSGADEFVVAMMGDTVFFVRESPDGTWVMRKELETEAVINETEETVMAMPCAALIDRNNHNVIVCSYGTSSMVVFSKEGQYIKQYGSRGRIRNDRFMDQTSCCINEITGELLIVDSHNDRVQIFK